MRPTDQVLDELATTVLVDEPRDAVLARVTALAREAIGPAEDVSLTLLEGERAFTAAHTGQLALDADELQYERGAGPCMDAARAGVVLVVSDMATEERWPSYAPAAAAKGVGSSLSVPLPVQVSTIGGLNVYSTSTHAFDDPDVVALSQRVAQLAAVVIANATSYASALDQARQLSEAMASRAVIEQAKGIIMGARRCSADDAFAELARASQHANRKLRDLAVEITQGVIR
ncbi:GAF domain-containing protein [Motilibacter rhizosphaerae]|uniref:GAF domain-containing protein n=1 Tax=Motilibacter rhizosphaerae TaxID=598652 RepID=A0A4Q7NB87_9ACTN|nr:GAF and ANTAR domain-containing protein [Motilibacter rhizosphaerae]RZS80155.1 GAF domain-containing protein [Motilibacter rhizosphaerae]